MAREGAAPLMFGAPGTLCMARGGPPSRVRWLKKRSVPHSSLTSSSDQGGGGRGLWGGVGGLDHPSPAAAAAAAAVAAQLPGAAGGTLASVFGDVPVRELPGRGLPEFAGGALQGLQLVSFLREGAACIAPQKSQRLYCNSAWPVPQRLHYNVSKAASSQTS
eukprot:1161814-Pelagomonas_calceolata.AAC.2